MAVAMIYPEPEAGGKREAGLKIKPDAATQVNKGLLSQARAVLNRRHDGGIRAPIRELADAKLFKGFWIPFCQGRFRRAWEADC